MHQVEIIKPMDALENFLESVENEALPVLQICERSLKEVDYADGQALILRMAIDRLQEKCRSVQDYLNDTQINGGIQK